MEAGIIAIWKGSITKISNGWFLCDGTNGTPDLRDKIIVGAGDSFSVDDSGGSATHTHTISIGSHSHDLVAGNDINAGVDNALITSSEIDGGPSDPSGERPPFRSMAYVMRGDDGLSANDAPRGIIVAWSGSIANIPEKWKLCDGTNGTSDLRDAFILGAGGAFLTGQTGGDIDHTHGVLSTGHTHSTGVGSGLDANPPIAALDGVSSSEQVPGTSELDGVLPPYYALAYIQKF